MWLAHLRQSIDLNIQQKLKTRKTVSLSISLKFKQNFLQRSCCVLFNSTTKNEINQGNNFYILASDKTDIQTIS